MASLKALLWDVDGTLVESEELHRRAFNVAFAYFALPWHWGPQEYENLLSVTGGKERIRWHLEQIDITEQELPVSVAELHAKKTSLFHAYIQNGELTLRSGVRQLLDEALVQGIRQAIVTTTSRSNIESLFDARVLDPGHWACIISGDMVKNKKPAPEAYHMALQKLAIRAENCLAVEDSKNGLQAAHSAEIATIITTSTYTRQQDFTDAKIVFDTLKMSKRGRPLAVVTAVHRSATSQEK